MKITFEKINTFVWSLAIGLVVFNLALFVQTDHLKRTRQYEIENNCKWDHRSEMCFTREQRPWMFGE